ncbi:glucose-6-phosphate isomerase [Simiduia agarivorans]|uniref:Glucose-6-phosphate isomerase n=1 Tax=Simiduia agarivorans (strain DSM 21679 / JCM 13881 / BCRC 17597 / SA1) TaxID=1117647 RepID=K4KN79_SIMAS|nr:glucose-6-phosphate isomerase [Simiduia agarivorans]AFU99573.1 glucose-6-phosphate isomerase [Simiduia agarivorans SA1 = DSM 21679]
MPKPTQHPSWQALARHRDAIAETPIKHWFEQNPARAEQFSAQACGIYLDFSKHRINHDTMTLLLQLAREQHLEQRVQAMYQGEPINTTEQRQVLHVALRSQCGALPDHMADVCRVNEQMARFVEAVHAGHWRGHTGERISDVVNIGIGGSDLGPMMVTQALTPFHKPGIKAHFVSNVDASDLCETLKGLNPATTLFVVASKTFTTTETLTNARSARDWLLADLKHESAVAKHFVAVSVNVEKVKAFGIAEDNIFPMWDWVGGRYSLWSAIGLPIALACGMEHFNALRAGAADMDNHFASAPLEQNLPVILAMLGIWYVNFWDAQSHAILPYDHYLGAFTKYIQQLDMESNGKNAYLDGGYLEHHTGPVIWGEVGTNGQHSFHQLLHQGTRLVPVDFIVALNSHNPLGDHHAQLFANCLSQSRALMLGKSAAQAAAEFEAMGYSPDQAEQLAHHKVMPGNRPSSTLVLEHLTPQTLGALIALYEHKIFVQSVIWGINAFDQWGVELGKQLCNEIHPVLVNKNTEADFDGSTNTLISIYKHAH